MSKKNVLPFVSLLFVLSFSVLTSFSVNSTKYSLFAEEIGDLNDLVRMPSMTLYGDTKSEMAFTWNTTNYDDSDLEIVKKSNGDFLNATRITGTIEKSKVASDGFIHRALANNLEEDTEYLYRFGDRELGQYSDVGEFKTSSSKKKNFKIVHLSDPQGWEKIQYDAYHDLLENIDELEKPNFLALTGDIVNNSWAEHTPILNQWEWALTDQWDILKNYPIAPVSGNHDAADNDFNSRYTLPNTSLPSGAYYSFDYEGVHFIGLNTNDTVNIDNDNASGLGNEQYNWLVNDLKNVSDARFVVVLMHKGIFDSGAHSTNNTGEDFDIAYLRKQLAPLFSQYGVDLVLQGHDHLYSLTYPIYSSNDKYELDDGYMVTKKELLDEEMDVYYNLKGTFYLNSGSASGSKYYAVQNTDNSIFHINKTEGLTSQCYTTINFVDNMIVLQTYTFDGDNRTPYYSFAISKDDYSDSNIVSEESEESEESENNPSPIKSKNNVALIIALSISGTTIVVGGLLIFIILRKRKK